MGLTHRRQTVRGHGPGWRRALASLLLAVGLAAPTITSARDATPAASPLPSAELQQLEAGREPAGNPLTLDARRQREARIAALAMLLGNDAAQRQVFDRLGTMATQEHCATCATELELLKAWWAMDHADQSKALATLNAIEAKLTDDSPLDLRELLHAIRANGLRSIGDFAGSVAEAVKAAELAEQANDTITQVDMDTLLGIDNTELGDFDRASEHLHEALHLAEQAGYGYGIALGWLNLGHMYARKDQRDAQRDALLTMLSITKGLPDYASAEVIALADLSDYYLDRKDWKQALSYGQRAKGLALQIGDQRALSVATINIGEALAGMGQTDEGVAQIKAAIDIAKRINNREYIVGMTHELIRTYEEAGRWRDADMLFHAVANDEKALTDQQRRFATLAVQEQFATERKTREIKQLSAENARQRAEATARNAQRWLWFSAAIALGLATILLAQWLRHLRRANLKLSEESSHDPLTGAFNRRYLEGLMAQHNATWRAAPKDAPPIALVMLDLDHFKRINDSWGHDAGDTVLVALVARMQRLLRQHDAVVRWGGEEFVLALVGANESGLQLLVPRILQAIANEPVEHYGSGIKVTLSAGAAVFRHAPGQDWLAIIHLADQALYLAKSSGRNRGVIIKAAQAGINTASHDFDLQAAQHAGQLELETIEGPPPVPAA